VLASLPRESSLITFVSKVLDEGDKMTHRLFVGMGAAAAIVAASAALVLAGGTGAGATETRMGSVDTRLVYARAGEIYVREADGTARRLTRNRVFDGFPTWSPDRSLIAFVRETRHGGRIHVMRADGTNAQRVTALAPENRGVHDLYPAWSPDGSLIAFASNRHAVEREIYLVRRDGTGLRRLTRTPGYVDDSQPRFSPDGRFLAFTSNRLAYSNYEIYRVRVADGRGLKRLTFWGSGADGKPGDDVNPSYSPDGKRIVFISDRRGGYAVWTMDADTGKSLREVTRHKRLNQALPRFSPDGRKIAYTTFSPTGDGSDARLWTVGTDGSARTTLGLGTEPDW
jgi:Tol biopolymer transport system component